MPAQRRIESIDVTKGLLTLAMIIGHFLALSDREGFAALYWLGALKLYGFSGYLFCFGFAYWEAYFSKPVLPRQRILWSGLKCVAAYLISGIAFRFWVWDGPTNLDTLWRILLFRDIPGYSEFLMTFALLAVISAFAKPLFLKLTESWINLAWLSVLCLAVCFPGTTIEHDPLIGLLIGGTGACFFPVVQYLPLFLLGLYFARHKVPLKNWAIVASALAWIFFTYQRIHNTQFNRYPPSAAWIVLSLGMFYLCYVVSIFIDRKWKRPTVYLSTVGRDVLFYLVASNLIIFALRNQDWLNRYTAPSWVAVYCALSLVILWIVQPSRKSHARNRQDLHDLDAVTGKDREVRVIQK